MKKFTFLLACLFSLILMKSYAQNEAVIDSLKRVYTNKKMHDTMRMDAMYRASEKIYQTDPKRAYPIIRKLEKFAQRKKSAKWIGRSYHRLGTYYLLTGNPDSACYYGRKSLTLSEKADDKLGESRVSNLMGGVYFGSNPDSALIFYQRSIDAKIAIGDEKYSREYLNMAMIYQNKRNFPVVLDFIKKALNQLKKYDNKSEEASAYGMIGYTHHVLQNYSEAEMYYLKQLKLLKESNISRKLIISYAELSDLYYEMGDNEKSENYLAQLKKISEETRSDVGMAFYHAAKFKILFDKNDFKEAEVHAKLCMEYNLKINSQGDLSFMQAKLGQINIENKQYHLAIENCTESYELATLVEHQSGQELSCSCLYEAYKALGQPIKALKYHELWVTYKDSLLNIENIETITQQKMQFDFDKKLLTDSLEIVEQNRQTEIAHLEDLEKGKRSRIMLFAAVGILFLIIGFVYKANRKKKKQAVLLNDKNDVINKSLHEKELLLKEIHHRVKNNFQTVSSLLELQSKGVSDEEALKSISDGQSRIRAMSLIHQKLYQDEDISTVDFQQYIEQLTKQIALMFSLKELEIEIKANDIQLDIDTSIPLGLILNELITNACKYAYIPEEHGKLTVTLNKPSKELYKLEVKDSGAGIPENVDLDKTKSLGLRLVRRLTKQLQGDFNYQFVNGGLFEITFKDTLGRKEVD